MTVLTIIIRPSPAPNLSCFHFYIVKSVILTVLTISRLTFSRRFGYHGVEKSVGRRTSGLGESEAGQGHGQIVIRGNGVQVVLQEELSRRYGRLQFGLLLLQQSHRPHTAIRDLKQM